jgi:hypothetical protein
MLVTAFLASSVLPMMPWKVTMKAFLCHVPRHEAVTGFDPCSTQRSHSEHHLVASGLSLSFTSIESLSPDLWLPNKRYWSAL